MDKRKYFSILTVIVLFAAFLTILLLRSSYYDVLKVISPFEIIVDKNSNGLADDGETIKIASKYRYFSKNDISLAKDLNLDEETAYTLAYLTEKFANDVLSDKKIDLKSGDRVEDITVFGEKYTNILFKSGYFFIGGKPANQSAYNKRLEQVKKNDYKIYNTKSNKYHKPSCEYGREAHNYVLLAKSQLPKGAKPCKYCSATQHPKTDNKHPAQKPNSLLYTSGAIKLFLTDFTTHLIPNRMGKTAICDEIVKQINSAKNTIDIAIYGYDSVPRIETALKRAISRGVKVRLVHDIDEKGKNIYEHTFQFSRLIGNSSCDRGFVTVENHRINPFMHNKFYIFDKSTVITGSANLSHTDMSDFNANSAILIHSKKIAEIYTAEFEQMYNGKYHTSKSKITGKENIQLGNSVISVYFSPIDKTTQTAIIPLINGAKKYIYMPTFLITDKRLTAALINARKRGVNVRIILDATNAKNKASQHRLLRQNGIEVKTENYAGKLHSKTIIIDDLYTISGSMNFSKSGETKNDENTVIIKNSGIATFYKLYFNYLWDKISNYWLTHDVSSESVFSVGSCSDGIDNDFDGKKDMEDEGCRFKPSKRAMQKP